VIIQGKRAGCTSDAGCSGTSFATLASWTITPNVSNITSPNSVIVTYGDANASFTTTASNYSSLVWQVSTNNGTSFNDLSNGTYYSGVNTTNLIVANPDVSLNGYLYRVKFNGNSPCGYTYSNPGTLTVNKAKACITYNGELFKNTTSTTTGGLATVKLSVAISKSPTTALGDLRTADVKIFVDDIVISGPYNISYSPNATSATTITYSISKTFTLSGSEYSHTYKVSWTVGGNYEIQSNCSDDQTQITVSTLANDFSTGGGYIFNDNSRGIIGIKAGETPAKNNFGFDVKWNKSLTNLQGHFNTIIRSGGRAYQVKSSNPNSTMVYKTPTGYRATITYTKANIQDLTSMLTGTCNPGTVWPYCSDGNGTVVLSIEDNGEPGSIGSATNDKIAITVKDKNGVLFYASNIQGVVSTLPTAFKYLVGGNIQIRSTTTVLDPNESKYPSTSITSTQRISINSMEQAAAFNINAYPNPSSSKFTLQLQSNERTQKVFVRILDMSGRTIQQFNNLSANQTLQIGSNYRPGMYIVEMIQGDNRKQLKLIKQAY
jgi:hypothetical protein